RGSCSCHIQRAPAGTASSRLARGRTRPSARGPCRRPCSPLAHRCRPRRALPVTTLYSSTDTLYAIWPAGRPHPAPPTSCTSVSPRGRLAELLVPFLDPLRLVFGDRGLIEHVQGLQDALTVRNALSGAPAQLSLRVHRADERRGLALLGFRAE